MRKLKIEDTSDFIKALIMEANNYINPRTLDIYVDKPLWNSIANITQDSQDNFVIRISEDYINDDYIISHEILHILARSIGGIPRLLRTLEVNSIGAIACELQGYLEHMWILNEQKKRGMFIDEFDKFKNLDCDIGIDKMNFTEDFSRILIICNLIKIYPQVFNHYEEFFVTNNSFSLATAKRIMKHYPNGIVLSNREARIATVKAIKEWNNIISEGNIETGDLSLLISVTPVFNDRHMQRQTAALLEFLPNAIKTHDTNETLHIVRTLRDNQCCALISSSTPIQLWLDVINKSSLQEFLKECPSLSYYTE